jgi:hypothetical protein
MNARTATFICARVLALYFALHFLNSLAVAACAIFDSWRSSPPSLFERDLKESLWWGGIQASLFGLCCAFCWMKAGTIASSVARSDYAKPQNVPDWTASEAWIAGAGWVLIFSSIQPIATIAYELFRGRLESYFSSTINTIYLCLPLLTPVAGLIMVAGWRRIGAFFLR